MKAYSRIISLTAALCIAASLAACGNKVESKTEEAETTTTAADDKYQPGKGIINEANGSLTDFSAETLSGSTVTQELFSGYDLTMIYIWQTTCEPCKVEFPAIEKLSSQLPEGVNLVGMCVDADIAGDEAKKIASDAGLTFENIIGGATLTGVKSTPTAVYVDKYGNVVGEPHEGKSYADGDDAIMQEYLIDISSHLGMARTKYAADVDTAEETPAETAPDAATD